MGAAALCNHLFFLDVNEEAEEVDIEWADAVAARIAREGAAGETEVPAGLRFTAELPDRAASPR